MINLSEMMGKAFGQGQLKRRKLTVPAAWDKLVDLLTRSGGEPPKVEHLREAADICLKKLGSRERAIPILLVTHDPTVAAAADRIILMRDGHVVEPAGAAL